MIIQEQTVVSHRHKLYQLSAHFQLQTKKEQ